MTHTTPGAAPDVNYEPLHCVEALRNAGLPLTPPFHPWMIPANEFLPHRIRRSGGSGVGIPLDEWKRRRATATANVAARRGERAA